MDKRLAKRILSSLPTGYAYADGVFYWRDFKSVLVGFAFDSSPSYIMSYKYALPLFLPREGHHFGYSEIIAMQNKRLGERNEEFERFYIDSIAPYHETVKELGDLSHFIDYVQEKIESNLRSGHGSQIQVADLRYCYACGLVLQGDYRSARIQVESIVTAYADYSRELTGEDKEIAILERSGVRVTEFRSGSLRPSEIAFLERVKKLGNALDQGGDQAKSLVLEVEEANRSGIFGSKSTICG
ncbi:hypothetical protein [Dyella mobilis]|uniref:Uncharacterized protein n=1 Tax=Dyella mobilis TaxID=1849582 RepID=A0ABS2KHL8_9GAMM|nr:hypothetical protein [Dyella mobilis]MBM7130646.1 hypothetical protein [Dyella mobilis]GLQ97273.1 hypothetical protein GCM10007863_16930 [Dyella mobilis]